jgi:hypothetical protein
MFAQGILGQRLTNEDGKEVMKIALVSFPIPKGLELKGPEILADVLRRQGVKGNAYRRIKRFGDNDTENRLLRRDALIGHTMQSQADLTESSMSLFSDLYAAAETAVWKRVPNGSGSQYYFSTFLPSLRQRQSVLLNDVAEVLSNPKHSGNSAFMAEYGGAFKQEWILQDGKIFSTDPDPTKGLVEVNIGLATDPEHARFIRWLTESTNAAFNRGARSIVALQIDGTYTVSDCGAGEKSLEFYNRSVSQSSGNGNHLYLQNNQSGANSVGVASNGLHSQQGGASGDSGSTSDTIDSTGRSKSCTDCGKGQSETNGTCSCRTHSGRLLKIRK